MPLAIGNSTTFLFLVSLTFCTLHPASIISHPKQVSSLLGRRARWRQRCNLSLIHGIQVLGLACFLRYRSLILQIPSARREQQALETALRPDMLATVVSSSKAQWNLQYLCRWLFQNVSYLQRWLSFRKFIKPRPRSSCLTTCNGDVRVAMQGVLQLEAQEPGYI